MARLYADHAGDRIPCTDVPGPSRAARVYFAVVTPALAANDVFGDDRRGPWLSSDHIETGIEPLRAAQVARDLVTERAGIPNLSPDDWHFLAQLKRAVDAWEIISQVRGQ